MAYIVSYKKFITRDITLRLSTPENTTELCTVDGVTYLSVSDGEVLADEQPDEIKASIAILTMTDELHAYLSKHSTHIMLINQRVRERVSERYSITDELKEMRNSPSPEFDAYHAYVEECRQWGHEQKALLGLIKN